MLDLKDKKIIVYGLGITGIYSIKAVYNLGAKVYIYDDRKYEEYKDKLEELKEYEYSIITDFLFFDFSDIYCVLKSPGIFPNTDFLNYARENNVEIISDIELAYRLFGGDNIIAVTGTNGKTTTTSLIAHILNKCQIKAKIAGNIGISILWDMVNEKEQCIYVVEMSSFQLDATSKFRPHISIITNITPDHLDWHQSFENYCKAKFNIFKNQKDSDILIINSDDPILSKINHNCNIKRFSLEESSDAYYKDGELIVNDLIHIKREFLSLVGNHNISNALSALLACNEFVKDRVELEKAISSFQSIEHRIEFVADINGVKYYNDSKGTNVDSTKVALKGFESDVILIAGGYDKGNNFDELFQNKNIKHLLLFGQTKFKIEEAARKNGIKNIKIFSNLDECVEFAKLNTINGDIVLFSPACASWDMYKNYEQRGNHFKILVKN